MMTETKESLLILQEELKKNKDCLDLALHYNCDGTCLIQPCNLYCDECYYCMSDENTKKRCDELETKIKEEEETIKKLKEKFGLPDEEEKRVLTMAEEKELFQGYLKEMTDGIMDVISYYGLNVMLEVGKDEVRIAILTPLFNSFGYDYSGSDIIKLQLVETNDDILRYHICSYISYTCDSDDKSAPERKDNFDRIWFGPETELEGVANDPRHEGARMFASALDLAYGLNDMLFYCAENPEMAKKILGYDNLRYW